MGQGDFFIECQEIAWLFKLLPVTLFFVISIPCKLQKVNPGSDREKKDVDKKWESIFYTFFLETDQQLQVKKLMWGEQTDHKLRRTFSSEPIIDQKFIFLYSLTPK